MAAIVTLYKTFKDKHNLGNQVFDFVQKLIENPANPSLHVEPVAQATDKRIRTARVTQQYRAVLFELEVGRENNLCWWTSSTTTTRMTLPRPKR